MRKVSASLLIMLVLLSLVTPLAVLPVAVEAQSDPYLDNKVFHAVDNSGSYGADARHNLTQAYKGYIVVSVAFKKGSATNYEGLRVGNSAGEPIAYLGTKAATSTWHYYDYAAGTWYDTGISVDTSEHNFTIAVNTSAQTVEFYIDGSKVGSFTSSRATDVYFIILATGGGSFTGSENWFDNVVVRVNGTTVFQDDFEDGTWDDNWFHTATGGAPPSGVTFEVITIKPPPFTLSNAGEPLSIPTYDGSGQATHPSIIYFETGYSYRYVLAFTPYPNGNDDYENPSVVFSNDNNVWTEDGVTNPLDTPPDTVNYHLCDTDIVWNGTAFLLYYLLADHSTSPYTYTLKVLVSTDGVHWEGPYSLFSGQGMVSPAIIYDRDEGKYKMWYVSHATSPNTVWYRESTDGFNWSSPIQVTFAASGLEPWHPEVQKLSNGMYLMLIAMYPSGGSNGDTELYLATSWDGLNWKVYDYAPVLAKGASGSWDEQQIYRTTFIVYDSVLYVWYSARNSASVWHIGFTSKDISDFLGGYGIYSDNVIGVGAKGLNTKVGTLVFDNGGGGSWSYYASFPIMQWVSNASYAVYKLVIDNSTWRLYNARGEYEAGGANDYFWDYVREDGLDIRVFDKDMNQLYFWIERFNYTERKATIWINVTEDSVEVNIAYGNPLAGKSSYEDPAKVFILFDDFDTLDTTKWLVEVSSQGGVIEVTTIDEVSALHIGQYMNYYAYIQYKKPIPSTNIVIEMRARAGDNGGEGWGFGYGLKDYNDTTTITYLRHRVSQSGSTGGVAPYAQVVERIISDSVEATTGGTRAAENPLPADVWSLWRGIITSNTSGDFVIYIESSGAVVNEDKGFTWSTPLPEQAYFALGKKFVNTDYSEAGGWGDHYVDWVRIYVADDPASYGSVTVWKVVSKAIRLPKESVYLTHSIIYAPNSTQFVHSFTAANTTTAGYEVNYSDIYGWRVYADPYQSGGVSYENNASLISEVDIVLPYTSVAVENLTFYAKSSGGSYRQIWVKVLDSSGNTIAELTNATVGVDWTKVVLNISTDLSEKLTIWINVTVKSTDSEGVETAIKDLKLHIRYDTNPEVDITEIAANAEYFNCSFTHQVELGNESLLNASVIDFKVIDYLTFVSASYPVQPVFIGNETIDSHNYSVYRIEQANYPQIINATLRLENKLKTFRTHVRGYDTETALVGEPVTIELPTIGNVTIPALGKTFINVTAITLRFTSEGTYTIEANVSLPNIWEVGYARKTITVKYGSFSVNPVDINAKTVDYEDISLILLNATSGSIIKSITGRGLLILSQLWSGNYSIIMKFKDIVVGVVDVELNITTDGTTYTIQVPSAELAKDYRGFNRSVILEYDKKLLSVKSLDIKYPYSRTEIAINGSGTFKLYINYRSDLPTKVSVVGNVSNLNYYWDGSYLVITGTLGSVGVINVTDLYKVRLELYDRLGNLMPSWIYAYVNETKYSGAIVEDYYYPEDYVIKLPAAINGFEFFSFFDGFNESVRVVSINNSDITLKAWYRVPTNIEVKSYQVSSTFIPFIKQEGETVKVYVEGYLRDYYGNGVPNRPLIINITSVEAGYTMSYNITTDVTGYFRSPVIELLRGKTYRIEVIFNGDDVYVNTLSTTEVKPEELPAAPAIIEIPVNYILAAVGVALIAFGVFAAVRAARHTIEDLRGRSRKFVRKKR